MAWLGRFFACHRKPFQVDEHTAARGAEAHAGSWGVSRWLRAVMDVYLPDFGIENLPGR